MPPRDVVGVSWWQCIVPVVSYALLATDVIRTGVGIRALDQYPTTEPDAQLYFGPVAYPVVSLLMRDDSTLDSHWPYWIFKYDKTSIGLRSIARHLGLATTWSRCIQYEDSCDERRGLPATEVFDMLDAVVEAVAGHKSGHGRDGGGQIGQITLRVVSKWFDRLHHYVFPWFFENSILRHIRAIHFDDKRLRRPGHQICGAQQPRPWTCHESWARYSAHCYPRNKYFAMCQHVDDIWSHITTRFRDLQSSFANRTIELLVLESSEDHSRQSLVYHGGKAVDVVALFRIRDCSSSGPCTTIAVDDYRYEAGAQTSSVASWFIFVATLRVVGQLYTWGRLGMLSVGCYVAIFGWTAPTGLMDLGYRCRLTLLTTFRIPSHVIIYGSLFPIACYYAAHLIDNTLMYQLVAQSLNSPLGQYQFHAVEVFRLCAVSMRSVWVAAIACHVVVSLQPMRDWSPIWRPPKFAITLIACLTITAQMRSTAWRNTAIVTTHEVSSGRLEAHLDHVRTKSLQGTFRLVFLGSTLDLKALMGALLAILVVVGVVYGLHRAVPRIVRGHLVLLATVPVPYSMGTLWPKNALMASWTGMGRWSPPRRRDRVHIDDCPGEGPLVANVGDSASLTLAPRPNDHAQQRRSQGQRQPHAHFFRLLNLAIMTDPVVFARLRVYDRGKHLVDVYRSLRDSTGGPQRLFPHGIGPYTDIVNEDDGDPEIDRAGDLELVRIVATHDLPWPELLMCG